MFVAFPMYLFIEVKPMLETFKKSRPSHDRTLPLFLFGRFNFQTGDSKFRLLKRIQSCSNGLPYLSSLRAPYFEIVWLTSGVM